MQWLAWALRPRTIKRGAEFVTIAVFCGPPIVGLLLNIVFAFYFATRNFESELLITTGFVLGSYLFGMVPAAIASVLIVVRRHVSILEALAITMVTAFLVYFVFMSASSRLSEPLAAAGTGLLIALLSLPGAAGVGLIAAWRGVLTPQRPPAGEVAAAPSTES